MTHSEKFKSYENERVKSSTDNDAYDGVIVWSIEKSLFFSLMFLTWIVGGIYYFSWSAFLLFLISSAVTLCAGHSVGMHRKLIHNSFECSKFLEYFLVYLGSLVGLGGPKTMIKTHDMRDWAQRQNKCHDYYGHKKSMMLDFWWQIHCDIKLKKPPNFQYESIVENNYLYEFLNRTSMLQQLPWAVLFYAIGGWGWVFWGVCGRVSVSVFGHWIVGYFAHNQGEQKWLVDKAHVQGFNVKFCSVITFGESWHNNHHAFPNSAKLGLEKNQLDLGWWLIKFFELLGLVKNPKMPEDLPLRPELLEITSHFNN